uniref:RING-type E3 ubiquitin transferase n=1 Tax=Amazona collaria TaxID=241587 RepID=A0A8B9G5J4_9PSIT
MGQGQGLQLGSGSKLKHAVRWWCWQQSRRPRAQYGGSTDASPVVQQIDQQFLVCSICLDQKHNLTVLPCRHTFCKWCLRSYIPCHQASILPEQEVPPLQSFFTDPIEALQQDLDSSVLGSAPGSRPLGAGPMSPLRCPSNHREVTDLYCEPCETAVCHEGTEGEHRPHSTVPLHDTVEHHKAALQTELIAVRSRFPRLEAALTRVLNASRQLVQRRIDATAEISGTFEELEAALRQQRELLLGELEEAYGAKHLALQVQLATLCQGVMSILSSCMMSEWLQDLAACYFPEYLQQSTQLDFLVETAGLRKSILSLGMLVTTSVSTHHTVATSEGLWHAVVKQPASCSVTTTDKDGKLVHCDSGWLHFQVTAPDGAAAKAEVQNKKNSTYELLYTPRAEGDFRLSILLCGQPIRGSPFHAPVVKASDMPPSPNNIKRCVKSPSGGAHIRQKAVCRPSSTYSTGKKENPIKGELIFCVGELKHLRGQGQAPVPPVSSWLRHPPSPWAPPPWGPGPRPHCDEPTLGPQTPSLDGLKDGLRTGMSPEPDYDPEISTTTRT